MSLPLLGVGLSSGSGGGGGGSPSLDFSQASNSQYYFLPIFIW